LKRRIEEINAATTEVPEPSGIDKITSQPDYRDGLAFLVAVYDALLRALQAKQRNRLN
jgi:hypothetical protein